LRVGVEGFRGSEVPGFRGSGTGTRKKLGVLGVSAVKRFRG
jgi:hypothetical protein